jgi:hypothetical protein
MVITSQAKEVVGGFQATSIADAAAIEVATLVARSRHATNYSHRFQKRKSHLHRRSEEPQEYLHGSQVSEPPRCPLIRGPAKDLQLRQSGEAAHIGDAPAKAQVKLLQLS